MCECVKKIIDYKLIDTYNYKTHEDFEQKIIELLQKGWELYGHLTNNYYSVCQAMIMRKINDKIK